MNINTEKMKEKERKEKERKENEDSDKDEGDDEKTLKAREWDNWKDEHEKGSGNRMKN